MCVIVECQPSVREGSLLLEPARWNEEYFTEVSGMIGSPSPDAMFDPEPTERVLGRELPRDYVALMGAYGGVVSTLEEAYLLITVGDGGRWDPRRKVEEGNYAVYYLADRFPEYSFMGEPRKISTSWILSREPYNVFRIGEVFGEALYLFFDPDVADWTVVLGSGDLWWNFRGGVCELLVKMVKGEVVLPYTEEGYFIGSSFLQEPRLTE
ncbi:hypothetical protein ABZ234_00885 [Nocardiopsis sp. NPDC006198]|uniref:hypothetical protein n=1 Tax=Nocardiopsis sp. NPDC006198 TaxID=3154472 RepID=UPI0033BF0CE3